MKMLYIPMVMSKSTIMEVDVQNIEILNELSQHTHIKVRTGHSVHDSSWYEKGSQVQYDLWIIRKGRVVVRMGGEEWVLQPDDMFFFYPNREYEAYTLDHSCDFMYSHFDFVVANNKDVLEAYNLDGYLPNRQVYREHRIRFQENYIRYRSKKGLYVLTHTAYFQALITEIIYYQSQKREAITHNPSQKLMKLKPAIAYIHQHLDKSIQIIELAEVCSFSEKYFISLFKDVLGMTPGQYINQAKMEKALGLLYKQKYSIKEIAYRVGYTDPYTFSKAFKKYYKVSPSRYKLNQL